MLKDLIGKEVTVVVSFDSDTGQGGSSPSYYLGKVEDVSDDFIRLSGADSYTALMIHHGNLVHNGNCIINTKYIISVFEK